MDYSTIFPGTCWRGMASPYSRVRAGGGWRHHIPGYAEIGRNCLKMWNNWLKKKCYRAKPCSNVCGWRWGGLASIFIWWRFWPFWRTLKPKFCRWRGRGVGLPFLIIFKDPGANNHVWIWQTKSFWSLDVFFDFPRFSKFERKKVFASPRPVNDPVKISAQYE